MREEALFVSTDTSSLRIRIMKAIEADKRKENLTEDCRNTPGHVILAFSKVAGVIIQWVPYLTPYLKVNSQCTNTEMYSKKNR
jgi:hypothetical protein